MKAKLDPGSRSYYSPYGPCRRKATLKKKKKKKKEERRLVLFRAQELCERRGGPRLQSLIVPVDVKEH